MGTVHLALCQCHFIPPAPAAFSIPVLPRQLLCLMPLLPLHRLGIPLFLLLLPCFSSFLSCYHSPHAPVLCLPPLAAAFERAAVYLSGLAAPLGRILPPHTAWSVLHVHPAPVFPDPIPAQSTLRSGVASHCVPSGATLSSLLPDSLYRYWGPTRPCSLGNPAMGSCDLDRDLRPLPFLFLPMISSFRCLAVA